MFAVRVKLTYNGESTKNQTGTKKKDRHTVASTAVTSILCVDFARSDLSPLFNKTLTFMRAKDDVTNSGQSGKETPGTCCRQCKTLQQLDQIFLIKSPEEFKRNLLEILFIALESTQFDGMHAEERVKLTGTVQMVLDVFDNLTFKN